MQTLRKMTAFLTAVIMAVSTFSLSAAEALGATLFEVEVFYGFGKTPGVQNILSGVLDETGGLVSTGNGYSIKGSASKAYTANASSGSANNYSHPKQDEIDSVDVYYAGSETPVNLPYMISTNTHCIKGTYYYDSSNKLTVYPGETTINTAHGTPLITFAAGGAGVGKSMTSRWRNVAADVDVVLHYNTAHFININTGDENAAFASSDIPKYFLTTTDNSADIEIGGDYSNSAGISAAVTPDAAPTSVLITVGSKDTLVISDVSSDVYITAANTVSSSHTGTDILRYNNGEYTFYNITSDINISYAYTTETVCAVFMADGSEFATEETLKGTTVSAPAAVPQKEGFVFKGWYADENLTKEFDFSAPISADTVVYAKFEKIHTITFKGGSTFVSKQYGLNVSASAWVGTTGGTWDELGTLTTYGDFVDTASASSSGVQVRVNSDVGTLESLTFTFGGHSVTVAKSDLVNNQIYITQAAGLTSSFGSNAVLKYALSNGIVFLRVYQVTQDIEVKVNYTDGSETVCARVTDSAALLNSVTVPASEMTDNTETAEDGFTVPYYELRGVESDSVLMNISAKAAETAGLKIFTQDGTLVASFDRKDAAGLKELPGVGLVDIGYNSASGVYSLRFLYLLKNVNVVLTREGYSEGGAMWMSAEILDTVTAKFGAALDAETIASYDSFVMLLSLGDMAPMQIEGVLAEGEMTFVREGIYLTQMNETLKGDIYGVKNGALSPLGIGLNGGISIAGYCDLVAERYADDTDQLYFMANMLRFASECQKYLNPDVSEEELPITGRQWAASKIVSYDPVSPEEIDSINTYSSGFSVRKGTIRSASLDITNKVAISYKLYVPEGFDGVSITINNAAVDTAALEAAGGGYYYLKLDRLGPAEYDDVYTAVLTNPTGTQTVKYSVDTYCERMKKNSGLEDITTAMYNYGYTSRNKIELPRIAFIGDSITFGYAVSSGYGTPDPATESYPAQFAEMMAGEATVGNFGRSGAFLTPLDAEYNFWAGSDKADRYYLDTAEYAASLEWDPDIVVIMLGTNDFRNLNRAEARENFKGYLKDLADTYMSLDSVKKVYIATSITIYSNAGGYELTTGLLQQLQKEAAAEGGYEVIDIYEMTKDYMSVGMHYSADRLHPVKVTYHEMAKAFAAFFKGETYEAGSMGQAPDNVVYLKTGGQSFGDGSTPDTALNSLSKAVGMLSETGGTVVLCGNYNIHYNYDMILPYTKKPITITSVYNGTNYGSTLGMPQNLHFNGEYTLENLNIRADKSSALFVCRYNNVTFGEGLNITLGSEATAYPGIIAGTYHVMGGCTEEYASFDGNCIVNIMSGTYGFFRGGNIRSQAPAMVGTIKSSASVTINISGGTFMNTSGSNLCAAAGMNSVAGTNSLNISGGTFNGPVCGLSRVGTNTGNGTYAMTGTVNIDITGGVFNSSIQCMQESLSIDGAVNLAVTQDVNPAVVSDGFTNITVR